MAARRTDMHRLQELVRLHRLGIGCREVARRLRMSTRTENKYRSALREAGLLEGDADELPELALLKRAVEQHMPRPETPEQQRSSIERFAPIIEGKLKSGAGPKAIYDYLRNDVEGFDGSYDAVKRLCRRLGKQQPPRPEDIVIPVLHKPGEVGQVDFGYLGKLIDPATGKRRKAYVFVMVLGFSRMMFARIVFEQSSRVFLALHVAAFKFFGGAPRTLVPDNLKAAVPRAAFLLRDDLLINPAYHDLARHYGCTLDPTPPYTPQHKGKVESAIRYVQGNFWLPRRDELDHIERANEVLERWCRLVAAERVHGTTGERPRALFEESERETLLALPLRPFEMVEYKRAMVGNNAHVLFKRALYSVPFFHADSEVLVRATEHSVTIYDTEHERLATHQRIERGYSTVATHLPIEREALRHRDPDYWRERAAQIGNEVGDYVEAIFGSDQIATPLRRVQAAVLLLERFPRERARAACKRAHAFGNYEWRGLERILRCGLDELEGAMPGATFVHGQITQPRFARSVTEMLMSLEQTGAGHGLH